MSEIKESSEIQSLFTISIEELYSTPVFRRNEDEIFPKTLKHKSHRHHRRDGVHDACSEERLGHLQLAAVAARVRVGGEGGAGRARAEGVGVALGGPGAVAARARAQPAPQRARHALAVLLPRAALARLAARRRRQPQQGLG